MREPSLDLRPIFLVIGLLLSTLSVAMLVPAVADLAGRNPDWQVFAAAAAVGLFVGLATILASRTGTMRLSLRQSFLLTVLGWLGAATVGSLPFAFSTLDLSATDAFFEAMSGITTTGATIIADLETAPPGILLWRALLQWMGGMGAIAMAVAVLPVLKIGGMEMFRLEGPETAERVMPRAARVASAIALVYVGITAALVLLLHWQGMTVFEALVHALSTISTGGYSTTHASLAAFDSVPIQLTVLVGMVVGGMPFVLLLALFKGRFATVRRDAQLRWYLGFILASGAAIAGWLWLARGLPAAAALHHGFFTAASVMSGTGYHTVDYGNWSGLPLVILFFLMFVGGCAGSTSAGIKVFRLQMLLANARVQAARLISPNTVAIPYYNRRPIPDAVAESVMGFLFVYALAFAVLTMLLGMLGLDFMTALSSAAASLGNVGPGFGEMVGPGNTYAELPDLAKWLLAAGMLLGRLEMFVVLVLFAPTFWRS